MHEGRPKFSRYRLIWHHGPWAIVCLLVILASIRAITAKPPIAPNPADESTRRRAFETIAAAEPSIRDQAVRHFPGDPWSQDDDFHNLELQRAMSFASQQRVSLGDVLRAVDDGMREGWTRPRGVSLKATVAPCRPRPIY